MDELKDEDYMDINEIDNENKINESETEIMEVKNDDESDNENKINESGAMEMENDDDESESESESEIDESEGKLEDIGNDIFSAKLIELENILSGNLKKMTAYDYLRYKALHLFIKGWKNENLTKIEASLQSAKIVYDKGSYKGKQIREWVKHWIENGSLPKSLHDVIKKPNL
jgi:hypothetical protein